VAKRLIKSGCRFGGKWGRSMDGCIRWSDDRRMGRGSFGGEFVVSHYNQRGRRRALPKLLWEDLLSITFGVTIRMLDLRLRRRRLDSRYTAFPLSDDDLWQVVHTHTRQFDSVPVTWPHGSEGNRASICCCTGHTSLTADFTRLSAHGLQV